MDLYLCANCKHIISSQGSMGIVAAMLGAKEGSILVMPEYKYFKGFREVFSQLKIILLKE